MSLYVDLQEAASCVQTKFHLSVGSQKSYWALSLNEASCNLLLKVFCNCKSFLNNFVLAIHSYSFLDGSDVLPLSLCGDKGRYAQSRTSKVVQEPSHQSLHSIKVKGRI
ncbi:unnamed protein product [Ixodes pacificus]